MIFIDQDNFRIGSNEFVKIVKSLLLNLLIKQKISKARISAFKMFHVLGNSLLEEI